jgi:ADP-ribosyltransferase exoenzyme
MISRDHFQKILSRNSAENFIDVINGVKIEKYAQLLIEAYCGNMSIDLNTYLRKTEIKEKEGNYKFFERILNKSLNYPERFNNQIVYRMDNPSICYECYRRWFEKKIGHVIGFPNFLSTSKERFRSESDVIFKIHTNNCSEGRDITPVIDAKKADFEKEVLFKSRSKFEIKAVTDDFIELNEVDRENKKVEWIYTNTIIDFELCPDIYPHPYSQKYF